MVDMLITEVDDALRKDKWQQRFSTHKRTLIWVIIALVLGTAGGQAYRHFLFKRESAFTATILKAQRDLASGQVAEAIESLSQLKQKAQGEQHDFAALWLARAQLLGEQKAQAADTLQSIITRSQTPSFWRDSACVWLLGITAKLPDKCTTSTIGDLSPLTQELIAASALSSAEYSTARKQLHDLSSSAQLTPQQRGRIRQLQLLLPPQSSASHDSKPSP